MRWIWIIVLLYPFLYVKAEVATGMNPTGSTIVAHKVDRAPKLDGKLDEAEWLQAKPAHSFIQREPVAGAAETERTEVRIIYSNRSIYVGAWCYDSKPDQLSAHYLMRDFNPSAEDCFVISLDTYLDKRNCVYLGTNPNGARYDALSAEDGTIFNPNWNGVWDVATSRDEKGWYVEMEIPFSTLRYSRDPEQTWGVNFERDVQRRSEYSFWQPLLPGQEANKMTRAGLLTGLNHLPRNSSIEMNPYGVAGMSDATKRVGNGSSELTRMGIDIKFPVTPHIVCDITSNTDFSTVEDDRAQVNLSRFPLFLPERRIFFQEGSGNFAFNVTDNPSIFYTRRIGYAAGKSVPILGGVRMVGRFNSSDFGILTMQTAEKGNEPTTNFAVARFKQRVGRESYAGFIVANKEQEGRANRTFGADLFLRHTDQSRHIYGMGGAAAISRTPGLNKNDYFWRAYLEYPNYDLESFLSFRDIGENFNPEMGYVTRYGRRAAFDLVKRWRPNAHGVRVFGVRPLSVTHDYGLNRELESAYYSTSPIRLQTQGNYIVNAGVDRSYERIEYAFGLPGNLVVQPGKYWQTTTWLELNSDQSRNLTLYTFTSRGDFYGGDFTRCYTEGGIKVGPKFQWYFDYEVYDIHLNDATTTTHNTGMRWQYAFNTRWESSLFAQWYNQTDRVGTNFRLHWMPNLGSDVYLSYNHQYDLMKEDLFSREATILCKVVYKFMI